MIAKKIFTLLSFLTTSLVSSAQDQVPMTVFCYSLHIDSDFQAGLGDLEEIAEDIEPFFRGKHPLKEGIIDETYHKLASHITEATEFEFLPIETLEQTDGKYIFYTPRGYPMGSKRRALTHQTSEYYGQIQVDVIGRTVSDTYARLGSFRREKRRLRPRVRITMKVFDEKGVRVDKYDVVAETSQEVIIQTKMSGGIKVGEDRRLKDGGNLHIVVSVIDEAIARLIDEIVGSKKLAVKQ